MLAVWHRRAVTANPRLYGISLLVSDDHGKTWRHTGDAGIGHGMGEGRIVELEDGRILLNARGGRAAERRSIRQSAVSMPRAKTRVRRLARPQ